MKLNKQARNLQNFSPPPLENIGHSWKLNPEPKPKT